MDTDGFMFFLCVSWRDKNRRRFVRERIFIMMSGKCR
jgi:hypothetical protein